MSLEGENPSSEMASTWSVGANSLLKALRDRVLRSDVSALCVLAASHHRGGHGRDQPAA